MFKVIFVLLVICMPLSALAQRQSVSDDDIRDMMIRESLAAYTGSCPCPYNRMRNGAECGRYSAYIKPGGASPLCYREDISREEVAKYRRARGLGG